LFPADSIYLEEMANRSSVSSFLYDNCDAYGMNRSEEISERKLSTAQEKVLGL